MKGTVLSVSVRSGGRVRSLESTVTDKRKKLIKAVAKRANVSHAGAANILRSNLRIDPKRLTPKDVAALYETDKALGAIMGQVYEKHPDVAAYMIGEGGEHILRLNKPKDVYVPLFECVSNLEGSFPWERKEPLGKAHVRAAVTDRMVGPLVSTSTTSTALTCTWRGSSCSTSECVLCTWCRIKT